MASFYTGESVGAAWLMLLRDLVTAPDFLSSPRGMPCRELLNVTWEVRDARQNIFEHSERNLSYRFQVAEWLWIWFGHDDVVTIAQYNKHIAAMASDDGVTFKGAYGPHVALQWPNIVNTLRQDVDSRQAVISIFPPQTKKTKDVPCTLTCQFFIREGRIYTTVNMRSSDVWLGLPYDVFNFSMLANILGGYLHLPLGGITYNLGSSHLYVRNQESAEQVLNSVENLRSFTSPQLPGPPPNWVQKALMMKNNGRTAKSWIPGEPWDTYAAVLAAPTNTEALQLLTRL